MNSHVASVVSSGLEKKCIPRFDTLQQQEGDHVEKEFKTRKEERLRERLSLQEIYSIFSISFFLEEEFHYPEILEPFHILSCLPFRIYI